MELARLYNSVVVHHIICVYCKKESPVKSWHDTTGKCTFVKHRLDGDLYLDAWWVCPYCKRTVDAPQIVHANPNKYDENGFILE